MSSARLTFIHVEFIGQIATLHLSNGNTYEGVFGGYNEELRQYLLLKVHRTSAGKTDTRADSCDPTEVSRFHQDEVTRINFGFVREDSSLLDKVRLQKMQRSLGIGGEKENGGLMNWADDTGYDEDFLDEEQGHVAGAWNQFEANQRLVKGESSYHELYYTTPVPTGLTKEQEERAAKLAREIETGRTINFQHAVDRNDDVAQDYDEETLYSSVIRGGGSGHNAHGPPLPSGRKSGPNPSGRLSASNNAPPAKLPLPGQSSYIPPHLRSSVGTPPTPVGPQALSADSPRSMHSPSTTPSTPNTANQPPQALSTNTPTKRIPQAPNPLSSDMDPSINRKDALEEFQLQVVRPAPIPVALSPTGSSPVPVMVNATQQPVTPQPVHQLSSNSKKKSQTLNPNAREFRFDPSGAPGGNSNNPWKPNITGPLAKGESLLKHLTARLFEKARFGMPSNGNEWEGEDCYWDEEGIVDEVIENTSVTSPLMNPTAAPYNAAAPTSSYPPYSHPMANVGPVGGYAPHHSAHNPMQQQHSHHYQGHHQQPHHQQHQHHQVNPMGHAPHHHMAPTPSHHHNPHGMGMGGPAPTGHYPPTMGMGAPPPNPSYLSYPHSQNPQHSMMPSHHSHGHPSSGGHPHMGQHAGMPGGMGGHNSMGPASMGQHGGHGHAPQPHYNHYQPHNVAPVPGHSPPTIPPSHPPPSMMGGHQNMMAPPHSHHSSSPHSANMSPVHMGGPPPPHTMGYPPTIAPQPTMPRQQQQPGNSGGGHHVMPHTAPHGGRMQHPSLVNNNGSANTNPNPSSMGMVHHPHHHHHQHHQQHQYPPVPSNGGGHIVTPQPHRRNNNNMGNGGGIPMHQQGGQGGMGAPAPSYHNAPTGMQLPPRTTSAPIIDPTSHMPQHAAVHHSHHQHQHHHHQHHPHATQQAHHHYARNPNANTINSQPHQPLPSTPQPQQPVPHSPEHMGPKPHQKMPMVVPPVATGVSLSGQQQQQQHQVMPHTAAGGKSVSRASPGAPPGHPPPASKPKGPPGGVQQVVGGDVQGGGNGTAGGGVMPRKAAFKPKEEKKGVAPM